MRAFYNPSLGLLVLRIGLGVIFFLHGAQKLFGWFGGPGIQGGTAFFASLGIPAPDIMIWVVGILELFGGLMLIAGFLVRVFGALLAIDMLTATLLFHLPAGFFLTAEGREGMEFTFILSLASLAVALSGAGAYSLDAKREGPTGAYTAPVYDRDEI